MLYVQFSDSTETTIVSWFASDPTLRSNEAHLGQVQITDSRYLDYLKTMPTVIVDAMPTPSDTE